MAYESRYAVNDCYTCIQGEGVQTGVAMVLLRLHGCAVGCPWCDTKETWAFGAEVTTVQEALGATPNYFWASAESIADYIQLNHAGPRWILLTGGEPADYDLRPLVQALQAHGYRVALETSGTALGHIDAGWDWVCVSPKIGMPGGKEILLPALNCADEIKFVVGKSQDIDQLDALLAQCQFEKPIQLCLQPISMSEKATKLCMETVLKRGWRLSIQTHKLLGVR